MPRSARQTEGSNPRGRRIIVVGGAGAIGRAYSCAAQARGNEIAVLDLATSLKAAGIADHSLVFETDVSDPRQVISAFRALASQWASADGLVYLSGFTLSPPRAAWEIADRDWCNVLDVNLTGAFRVACAARALLSASTSASIVFVSSAMAFGPIKGFAPYIASKAGLIGLTRALAVELAPAIRVNALAPSAMETPFLTGGTGRTADSMTPGWFSPEDMISGIPLGRLAQTRDCIGALQYLLGENSAFMTGQVLHINGGRSMR